MTKNSRGVPQYPLLLLLQLDLLRAPGVRADHQQPEFTGKFAACSTSTADCSVYVAALALELGAAGLECRLGGLPLDCTQCQLAMSDKQTTMSNDKRTRTAGDSSDGDLHGASTKNSDGTPRVA